MFGMKTIPAQAQFNDTDNRGHWKLCLTDWAVDGLVAVQISRSEAVGLTLTMGSDDARVLAAELIAAADHEDAKLDGDDADEDVPKRTQRDDD